MFRELNPGPVAGTPPVSGRVSGPPLTPPGWVGPGSVELTSCRSLALGRAHQAGTRGSPRGCGHPASTPDDSWPTLVRAVYTPISICPAAHVLLRHPVCTHRHVACLVRHETVLSLTHPSPSTCAHVPGAAAQGRVKSTSSLPAAWPWASLSAQPLSALSGAPACVGLRGCCVCAHVYAQTVHTCASHEKMFISYMDIQTCMARKTPSLHVHRMGGVTKWV